MSWMTVLVCGYIRANTTDNVFVSDLIEIFLRYFGVYLEISFPDLLTEYGVKLSIPQLDEQSQAIKDQYEVQELEENSSDDDYIEHAKFAGDWEEIQKWEDKGMCFLE